MLLTHISCMDRPFLISSKVPGIGLDCTYTFSGLVCTSYQKIGSVYRDHYSLLTDTRGITGPRIIGEEA